MAGRKRLRILGRVVPHGFRKGVLLEALIRLDVPLLRATWFIRTMLLNQVRTTEGPALVTPAIESMWVSIRVSTLRWTLRLSSLPQRPQNAGTGGDKLLVKRCEQWTGDLLDYGKGLMDAMGGGRRGGG